MFLFPKLNGVLPNPFIPLLLPLIESLPTAELILAGVMLLVGMLELFYYNVFVGVAITFFWEMFEGGPIKNFVSIFVIYGFAICTIFFGN